MSTTAAPQYPFDPTGKASTNLITDERQTLSPPDWSDFYFIVPAAAPFFKDSLVVTLVGSNRVLKEGVDFNSTHYFYDASKQCATPVYGSITFLDRTLSGVVSLQYQTLGGEWTLDSDEIATILANTLMDPRITTWEEVVNLPIQFPPIKHPWNIVDMTGAADVVAAINKIVEAMNNSGTSGLAAHIADHNNPHQVTAAQVGLGNVQNFGMATNADAQAGSSTSLYMSPSATAAAITTQALAPLNGHIGNTNNPHQVTSAQVGLGNVQNFGMASSAQAQAGSVSAAYMSPATTAAAINTQALTPLNAHVKNTNNPHQVTQAQVGLGNVPNYAMATAAEALAGTSSTAFVSPALVTAMMSAGAGGNLAAHIADHNNPHEVTAAQVGLGSVQNYGVASTDQATSGTDNSTYMTPALVAAAVNAQALKPLNSHISNTSNPHEVTAAQVGLGSVANYAVATTAAAQAGTDNASYMTPQLTAAAITTQALAPLNAHIGNTDNPHQVTAAQIGLGSVQNYGVATTAAAQAGTDTSSYMTPALVAAAISKQALAPLNSHIGDTNNPHSVTAEQLGLGNVANYAVASVAEANAGTDTSTYMTPALTAAAITTQALTPLNSHVSNTNNPHQVTAAQVGLGNVPNYPVATQAQAVAGTDNATLVTPALVTAMLGSGNESLSAHIADHNNPHQVTADQVGLGNVQNYGIATADEITAGTTNAAYMTPQGVASLVNPVSKSLSSHVADINNPHQVTAAQVGTYAQSDIDAKFTALGSTYLAIGGTASNSTKFNGFTYSQLQQELQNSISTMINYDGIADSTDALSYTTLAQLSTDAPDSGSANYAPLIFEVIGGDPAAQDVPSRYRVTVNELAPTDFVVEQLSGYPDSIVLGYAPDSTVSGQYNIYLRSSGNRNPITIIKISDPGSAFLSDATVVDAAPSGFVQLAISADRSVAALARETQVGQVMFGPSISRIGSNRAPTSDLITQVVNVSSSSSDDTAMQALSTDYAVSVPNWMAVCAKGQHAYRANTLVPDWAWDASSEQITLGQNVEALAIQSLLSESTVNGVYSVELLVSSSFNFDYAMGLVAGFTDDEGQPTSLQILRDMGGLLTAVAANPVPGDNNFGLLTVGFNLFQDDGEILIGKETDALTWGDGVSNSAAREADYKPISSDNTTSNGWANKGSVAIKVSIDQAGTITVSTSDYNASASSPTYVVTKTLDPSTLNSAHLNRLVRALTGGGRVRWGVCSVTQPMAAFQLLNVPDAKARYISSSGATQFWNGSAWASIVNPDYAGRFVYSPYTGSLYVGNRNGSLRQLPIEAAAPSGTQILTT